MKSRTLTRITAMTLFAALAIPVRLAAQEQQQNRQQTRYKLIDFGTFGGPTSYLPGPPPAVKVLNDRGTAVGWADTSTPDPFPTGCFNPDCFVSHAFQWQDGTVTDLGTLADGWSSAAVWISTNGLIAGFSENGVIDPLTGFPEGRGVLWKDGQIIDLGTLEGGNESLAFAVNSAGQVVGPAANTVPDPFSLFGWGAQTRAFLWQNGVMQDLGTLGGPDAFAAIMNERGQVAGSSYTSYTPGPSGVPQIDPFLWENSKMIDLGGLGGSSSAPNDLNNRGQVVGIANLAGDLTSHPFLWDRGVMTDLGTLGGNNGQATALNDHREVVGYADLPGSTSHHAFLWKNGAINDLGVLEGFSCSAAWFISPKGRIVGHSHDCVSASDAVLWENGGPPINLNTRIPSGSALHLKDAFNINDRGEIAGYGVLANGDQHAYLLIPCDDNHGDGGDCEDNGEERAAAPQTSPALVMQDLTMNSTSPSENMSANRARFGRRHQLGGFGTY
jgi:probable HAF family extracellular repeat protein